MSIENFFPAHYPWQRVLANMSAGGGGEMNIGNPVVCMYEAYAEPTVGGDASYMMVFNGISYEDNVIIDCADTFYTTGATGAIASGLTLIERIWGSVTLKFYDAETDSDTGKYTSVEEIDVDYDSEVDGDYTVYKFVIPELEEGHIFVIYTIESE